MTSRTLPRIKLLALDIDDTLTGTDGRISAANLAAVELAREQGVIVTVITGRRYRGSAERFAAQLGVSGPIGCHYGRAIVEHPSGRFLRCDHVPVDVSRLVVAYATEHDLAPSVCTHDTRFADRSRPANLVEFLVNPPFEWVDGLDELIDQRGHQIMWVGVSGPGSDALRELLGPHVRTGSITVHTDRMPHPVGSYTFALAGASDKGTALVEICRLHGVDPSESVALGDSEADIPMLRAAGVGIAMPWAAKAVQCAADIVAQGTPENAAGAAICRLLSG